MNRTNSTLFDRLAAIIAHSFGAGFIPFAPGTAGALVALPIYAVLQTATVEAQLSCLLIMFSIGVLCCHVTTRRLGQQDHQSIVWDETVGALAVLLVVPATAFWWVAAILMFRVFDILKPWPIRLIDKYTDGGFAIMLDDLAASIFAVVILIWLQRILN